MGELQQGIDQGNLGAAFFSSVLYSLGATVIAVLISALAAYVLARRRTRRHWIICLLLITGIAVPTNFVTLTKGMQFTHLIDTQIGLVVLLHGDPRAAQRLPDPGIHRCPPA